MTVAEISNDDVRSTIRNRARQVLEVDLSEEPMLLGPAELVLLRLVHEHGGTLTTRQAAQVLRKPPSVIHRRFGQLQSKTLIWQQPVEIEDLDTWWARRYDKPHHMTSNGRRALERHRVRRARD